LSRDMREYASVFGVHFSDTKIRDDGQELAEWKTSHLARTQVADTGLKHIDRKQAFGRRQVEAVIRDRPDMAVVIIREPALREMLESRFEGDGWSGRVRWDNREPRSSPEAEHEWHTDIQPTRVRISKNPNISA